MLSIFSEKAKLRINGLKKQTGQIKNLPAPKTKRLWFHCASLGEFEQARPLIEKIKQEQNIEIILTFFSPSGYEIRKNYEFADFVFYLPHDTRQHARHIIQSFRPTKIFWVKYEFWHHYLYEIQKQQIPLYLISGIFRQNQIYFKPYGKFFKAILQSFTHLFVQDINSEKLLKNIALTNVTVCGDTRFDRVIKIAEHAEPHPIIEKFKNNNLCIIAGSTWQADEKILLDFFNKTEHNLKLIIAPHEIHELHLRQIERLSLKKTVRYSKINSDNANDANILLIDNIGMLSSLYQYADIVYIGGGFGVSIHNTQEAAVYGVPVIIGSKYHKFREAVDLINLGGYFSINNQEEFTKIIEKLISNVEFRHHAGKISKQYMYKNKGASQIIYNAVFSS